MTSYLKAKYIAHNDNDFHHAHVYLLEVRQHWFGRITVRPTHGYAFKPIDDMQRTYRSLKAFLHHWKVMHIIEPLMD